MKLKHLLCFIPALLIASCNPVYASEKQQQTLEQAGANLIEKFGNKALEYTQALEEITKQYAPDVVNAALNVIQLGGVGKLLEPLPLIALGIFFLWFTIPWIKKGFKKSSESVYYEALGEGMVLTFLGIYWAFVCVIMYVCWFNIWNWVQVFEPKLWIAYKILGKLL